MKLSPYKIEQMNERRTRLELRLKSELQVGKYYRSVFKDAWKCVDIDPSYYKDYPYICVHLQNGDFLAYHKTGISSTSQGGSGNYLVEEIPDSEMIHFKNSYNQTVEEVCKQSDYKYQIEYRKQSADFYQIVKECECAIQRAKESFETGVNPGDGKWDTYFKRFFAEIMNKRT